MPQVMYSNNMYKHTSFDFIPEQYRVRVKVALLVPAGLAIMFLMVLVVQGM